MTVVRFEIDGWDFDGALCREIPDAWLYFFPEKGLSNDGSVKTAKMLCAVCPVKQTCANYAISNTSITHGIWGGMGIRQIQRIRATLGINMQEEEEDGEVA